MIYRLYMGYFSFGNSTARKLEHVSKHEIRPDDTYVEGGGCMTAVYKTLNVLLGPEFGVQKKFGKDFQKAVAKGRYRRNSIEYLFEELERIGNAHPMGAYKEMPRRKNRKFRLSKYSDVETLEDDLIEASSEPGWHYFGVSQGRGNHSGIIAVDATKKERKLYWLDQNSRGYREEMTGSVAPYLFGERSKIWHILPNPLFDSDKAASDATPTSSLEQHGTAHPGRFAGALGGGPLTYNLKSHAPDGHSENSGVPEDFDDDSIPGTFQHGRPAGIAGKASADTRSGGLTYKIKKGSSTGENQKTFADSDGDGVPDFLQWKKPGDRSTALSGLGDLDHDSVPDNLQSYTSARELGKSGVPGDLDNDGIADVLQRRAPAGAAQKASTDFAGGNLASRSEEQPLTGKHEKTFSDSDGDGIPDLLQRHKSAGKMTVSGAFDDFGDHSVLGIMNKYTTAGKFSKSGVPGDFDGDGIADIFQKGTLAGKSKNIGVPGDIDGDGIPDVPGGVSDGKWKKPG